MNISVKLYPLNSPEKIAFTVFHFRETLDKSQSQFCLNTTSCERNNRDVVRNMTSALKMKQVSAKFTSTPTDQCTNKEYNDSCTLITIIAYQFLLFLIFWFIIGIWFCHRQLTFNSSLSFLLFEWRWKYLVNPYLNLAFV